ncbi:MAG: protein-L-isoaspartate(D-aspartate) O-methyltransferase [Pirellulales bacterium]
MKIHWLLTTFAAIGFAAAVPAPAQIDREWRERAGEMVDKEIAAAGVTNERVIGAMRDTPRHEFVPNNQREYAYLDMALPIGEGQTISPPFIVAYMTQEIDPQPTDRVLEIGTGSGYQAAVLSLLVKDVYTIEIVDSLSRRATRDLKRLGYKNVLTRAGDGYKGWPEAAPFDKIIVTCSPEKVPQPLVDQLREGGLMIVPTGERYQQNLYLMRKVNGKLKSEALRATLFVPMTGEAEVQRAVKPDPKHPQVANGSFEEVLAVEPEKNADESAVKEPAGWHYQRQLKLKVAAPDAPNGKSYVTFHNAEPDRGSHALQGFAVDGRAVATLRLSFSVRGENIRSGGKPDQWPKVVITFYDDRRQAVGEESVGPFTGSFPWRTEEKILRVPLRAREAILRIGLLGAVGEFSLDDLRLQANPSGAGND